MGYVPIVTTSILTGDKVNVLYKEHVEFFLGRNLSGIMLSEIIYVGNNKRKLHSLKVNEYGFVLTQYGSKYNRCITIIMKTESSFLRKKYDVYCMNVLAIDLKNHPIQNALLNNKPFDELMDLVKFYEI